MSALQRVQDLVDRLESELSSLVAENDQGKWPEINTLKDEQKAELVKDIWDKYTYEELKTLLTKNTNT